MKLGFFCMPPKCPTALDKAKASKKYGFDYIEPSIGFSEFAPFLSEDELVENAKRVKEIFDEHRLKSSCFSFGTTIIGENKHENIAQLKKIAKVCQILECPYLHHTIYLSCAPFGYPPFSKDILDEGIASVREVYDYAEQFGVKCVYEDQGFVFNGCERFEIFLNEVNRDVKVVADLGNVYFADETSEEFVGRFMPYIAHVHIKDYLKKPGSGLNPGKYWNVTKGGNYLRDTVIGHGVIDFEKVFKMFIRAKYEGTFSLECSGLEIPNDPTTTDLNVANTLRFWENAKRDLDI